MLTILMISKIQRQLSLLEKNALGRVSLDFFLIIIESTVFLYIKFLV